MCKMNDGYDDAAISAVGSGKKYGSYRGLRNSTFSAGKKELAVLLGLNGTGKTTTSKIFATVLKPSKGSASILGLDIAGDHRAVRKRVSYLPQEHELTKNMTPLESFTLKSYGYGRPVSLLQLKINCWLLSCVQSINPNKCNGSLDRRNNACPFEVNEVGTRMIVLELP
jgi:ABC-type multidrug transport system ATPase subunit